MKSGAYERKRKDEPGGVNHRFWDPEEWLRRDGVIGWNISRRRLISKSESIYKPLTKFFFDRTYHIDPNNVLRWNTVRNIPFFWHIRLLRLSTEPFLRRRCHSQNSAVVLWLAWGGSSACAGTCCTDCVRLCLWEERVEEICRHLSQMFTRRV